MKKIIIFFIVLFLYITSCIFKSNELSDDKIEEVNEKLIKINYNNEIIEIPFEDYVVGVVACEMPSSFNIEALKAQAVASRTYATYKLYKNSDYIMKTTTSDQCYISKDIMKSNWKNNYENNYNKIYNAAYETKNEIITYNNEPIISFFFSMSNGYTENVENVFVQKLDYLVSVDSPWDENVSSYIKTKTISLEDFKSKLNINSIDSISIDRYITGRVKTITINNKKYKGTEFRTLFSLRSADFDLEIGEQVIITTKGYGHGVGLSQYGANEMAKLGYNYKEILKHYYTNVNIVNNL